MKQVDLARTVAVEVLMKEVRDILPRIEDAIFQAASNGKISYEWCFPSETHWAVKEAVITALREIGGYEVYIFQNAVAPTNAIRIYWLPSGKDDLESILFQEVLKEYGD